MLRGRLDTENRPVAVDAGAAVNPSPAAGFPPPDQAYATEERPSGILFYLAKESFWLPYHLLQTMQCQPDRLTLTFATDELVLVGRGLHELYVHLARQSVWRIVEQGERYAQVSEAPVFVTRIDRNPIDPNQQPHGKHGASQ